MPRSPVAVFVDDESYVLSSIARVFKGSRIRIEPFEAPEAALEYLSREDAEVVASDYRMPSMSGSEFLERAAALRPGARRLLVSGQADFSGLADAVNYGSIARFVSKPWKVEELRRIVFEEAAAAIADRFLSALPPFQQALLSLGSEEETLGAVGSFAMDRLGVETRRLDGLPGGEREDGLPELAIADEEGRPGLVFAGGDLGLFADAGAMPRARALLAVMARYAFLVLRDLSIRGELQRLSERDSLSGLRNRRSLDEALEREYRRSARYGAELSVMLIDIDKFKDINDSRGHAAGDEVIRRLGALMLESIRSIDVAARYGGDEFLIALPAIGAAKAEAVAERLRAALADRLALPFPVTLSIGVADLREGMGSLSDLLAAADEALYQAKRGGRDRVVRTGSVSR